MHIIYSDQRDGFEPGKRYRNPAYFQQIEDGTTSVTVIGDWPAVVKACKDADIPCEVDGAPKPKASAALPAAAPVTINPPAEIEQPDAAASEHDIRKGPRGMWYLYRDGSTASPGYATEAEARAAVTV